MYKPIGVFDSGYGGLTVLRDLTERLPQYDYLYLGDNARAPYGLRDFDTIYQYSLESVKWLFAQGCHLVILACNTASARALRNIQQKDLPHIAPHKRVLGVIRPTAEMIGTHTKTGHVGVLGTPGTIKSGSYILEIAKFFPEVKVNQEACTGWVELVENNLYNTDAANEPVRQHIEQLLAKDAEIDTLLLACTHYPLLLNKIKQYVPPGTDIISQGNIVAESLADYLQRHPEIEAQCSKAGSRKFFTSGKVSDFEAHASAFFGKAVEAKQIIISS